MDYFVRCYSTHALQQHQHSIGKLIRRCSAGEPGRPPAVSRQCQCQVSIAELSDRVFVLLNPCESVSTSSSEVLDETDAVVDAAVDARQEYQAAVVATIRMLRNQTPQGPLPWERLKAALQTAATATLTAKGSPITPNRQLAQQPGGASQGGQGP